MIFIIIVVVVLILAIASGNPTNNVNQNLVVKRKLQAAQDKYDIEHGITKEDRIELERKLAIVIKNRDSDEVNEKNERLAYLNHNHIAYCPKCTSQSVTPVKKGFGVGKAAAGGLILGPVGLVGGAIGANKIEFVCANCGHRYKR